MELEHVVTLMTLGSGAAHELFQEELNKVVENILDVNTNPTSVREVKLLLKIKPDENSRQVADVEISCSSKTAPVKSVDSRFYLGRREGRVVAVEHNPEQLVFDEMKPKPVEFPQEVGNVG